MFPLVKDICCLISKPEKREKKIVSFNTLILLTIIIFNGSTKDAEFWFKLYVLDLFVKLGNNSYLHRVVCEV